MGVHCIMKNAIPWNAVIEHHALVVCEMKLMVMYCQRNRLFIGPFLAKYPAVFCM
ncbi:hypothetical protein HMPREF0454_01639 [Hafnia alvei ATCC 51873]|uniref:Uncharacterized protein n=1 Tax=Hafnia alvei ATCC 51873 TaxID=1002364 RepID=G9Y501_HAFAL|nr:hypothetical protein HMPREF0454_01639 [Hafnia alvei ATCC 51873]